MRLQGTEKQIEYATKIRNTKNITKEVDKRAEYEENLLIELKEELKEDIAGGDQEDIEETQESIEEIETFLNEWYSDKKEIFETTEAVRVIEIRNKYKRDMKIDY